MTEEVKIKTRKLKNGLTRVKFEPGIKLGDFFAAMQKQRDENDDK